MDDEIEKTFPIIAVIKTSNDSFLVIKFELIDGAFHAMSTELTPSNYDNDMFYDMTMSDILYAKLTYDFSFDDEDGISELEILEIVTYETDSIYEIVENDFHEFMNLYTEYISRPEF